MGGVLGTIFAMISILLIIKTFNQQRVVTNENKRLAEVQRLNDLFFELLRLYQEQVKDLRVVFKEESNENKLKDDFNVKDFFDYNMKKMQDDL
ncbi:MAG: hypothetical protein ACK5JU_11610 [Bacteroidales bacterium]